MDLFTLFVEELTIFDWCTMTNDIFCGFIWNMGVNITWYTQISWDRILSHILEIVEYGISINRIASKIMLEIFSRSSITQIFWIIESSNSNAKLRHVPQKLQTTPKVHSSIYLKMFAHEFFGLTNITKEIQSEILTKHSTHQF